MHTGGGAVTRLVADGVAVLIAAGVRVLGPCREVPVSTCWAVPPALLGKVCWLPVWFDPRRLYWMEVVVKASWQVVEYSTRDPLGALLGILPSHLDSLLGWARVHGRLVRRELRAQGELRGRLQVVLARGAMGVYQTRCRLMDGWWRAPERAPDRDRLDVSAHGRALLRARSKAKRESDAFELRCASRRNRRLARVEILGGATSSVAGVNLRAATTVNGVALAMVSDTPVARTGGNAVFILSVRNEASVTTGRVTVRAPLPTGCRFVAADYPSFAGGTGV